MSAKSKKIIDTIADLFSYATAKLTVEEVKNINYNKLIDKEEEWDKAFANYDENDVIQAVNHFWRYKNDKSRPSIAQILVILNSSGIYEKKEEKVSDIPEPDYPIKRFKQDLALGICHHNLYIYQDAYRLQKSRKTALFEDLLKECCLKRCGREFEFPSNEELIENKINPAEHYPLEETKGLLKTFIRNGGKL